MRLEGGCYCGALRYAAEGEAQLRVQCHCRECQYLSGGAPNLTIGMPEDGFVYEKGEPRRFQRPDLDNPVTREFCGECGTHILTRAPGMPGIVLMKVGCLDDPEAFEGPELAIFTAEARGFHHIPEGLAAFDALPR